MLLGTSNGGSLSKPGHRVPRSSADQRGLLSARLVLATTLGLLAFVVGPRVALTDTGGEAGFGGGSRPLGGDCTPLPCGILSGWSADSTAEDAYGDNDGTLIGGATYAMGEVRQAFHLDGTDDGVMVPDSPTLEPARVTVEAWVRSANPGGPFRYIVGKGAMDCGAASYALYTGWVGALNFYILEQDHHYVIYSPTAYGVWDGQWHHIAGTYDGTAVRLYVDGTEAGAGTANTSAILYNLPSYDDLYIGYYAIEGCQSEFAFAGDVDEVAVYDRALARDEIATIYLAGSAGKCSHAWQIVSTLNLDFGSVEVGSHSDKSFSITNGDTAAHTGSVSEACDHYTIVSGAGAYSLSPGESLTVVVRFEPVEIGADSCGIPLAAGCVLPCIGVGEPAPSCSVDPTDLDFGGVAVGNSGSKTFAVTNVGGGTLSGVVSEECDEYSIVSGGGPYDLTAGEVVVVTVQFEPTGTGTETCTVETGGSCSAVSCTGVGVLGSTWEDVTSGPLGDPGNGIGVAWGDYDDDGDEDLYISNYGGANKLLRNDGEGVFADATTALLGDTGNGYGVVWGDYDGDGDLDLYLVNGGTANKLFRNDGGGVFTDATADPLGDTGQGRGTAWADYDNDGDLDLYLVNSNTANRLFRNDGGTFVDATSGPLGLVAQGRGVAWGDYDNDGDLDLYVLNNGSSNKLLRNDGGGVFVDVTTGPLGTSGPNMSAAWGDYDNDGDLDLYMVRNGASNKLLRNDGAGVFTDATTGALAVNGPSMGSVWGDYDNDGDQDLYITSFRAPNLFLRNDGGGVFANVTLPPLGVSGESRGVACGDYDNDGDLDLYVVMNGANKMFRDNAPLYHWLEVRLVGSSSNTCSIGARLRVVAGGRSQIGEISGGCGYMSQNSMIAHFGLGHAVVVDTLEVRWPTGALRETTDVAADHLLVMTESTDQSGVSEPLGKPSAYRLYESRPNPSGGVTTIRYDLPKPVAVTMRIYDIAGRVVRVLRESALEQQGRHEVPWDGRSDGGREVTPGIYFCRLEVGGFLATRKMVLMR